MAAKKPAKKPVLPPKKGTNPFAKGGALAKKAATVKCPKCGNVFTP